MNTTNTTYALHKLEDGHSLQRYPREASILFKNLGGSSAFDASTNLSTSYRSTPKQETHSFLLPYSDMPKNVASLTKSFLLKKTVQQNFSGETQKKFQIAGFDALSVHTRANSIARPWSTGFVTCAAKGLAADLLIQCAARRKNLRRSIGRVDFFHLACALRYPCRWELNIKIKIQGGWYCGWFQHGLYNIVYRRIFGVVLVDYQTRFEKSRSIAFSSSIRLCPLGHPWLV